MRHCLILILATVLWSCNHRSAKEAESLVYLSNRDGNFDLYTNDILGQWEKRITTNQGWDWSPKWNEGRNQLIYYTNDTAQNFSVIAKSLKSDRIDTLPNSQFSNYQLSPDGQRILYTVKLGESQNIWSCSLDGTDQDSLTNDSFYNGRFSISPMGDQLLFISDRSGSNELYLLQMTNGKVTQLTDNEMVEKYNTWSPDGKQIAFTMRTNEEGSKEDIYILNLVNMELKRLTSTPYAEQEIAWSLNGDKIAFHGTTEDGDHIYTIDILDGKFTKITSGDAYHGEPAWLPGEY